MASLQQQDNSLASIQPELQPAAAPPRRDAPEWDLNRRLQTTLDVSEIIKILHDSMVAMLYVEHTAYHNSASELDIQYGQMARHNCNYSLTIGGETIGRLVFARSKRFSSTDLEQIENLLCLLVYPLRNALMYQQALQMAMKDPLTGTLNRSAMDMMLTKEVELANRHNTPMSLIVLDIDHFKRINDDYGHSTGDSALKALASRIRQCVRATDSIFRYGGEEFVIMLSNTDQAGAQLLAERIRQSVEEMLYVSDRASLNMTISLGIASLEKDENAESIFDRADHALYEAKTSGRNRTRLAAKP